MDINKLKEKALLKVESHSEGIVCPHCSEEFGIESNIQSAYEDEFTNFLNAAVVEARECGHCLYVQYEPNCPLCHGTGQIPAKTVRDILEAIE